MSDSAYDDSIVVGSGFGGSVSAMYSILDALT